jgi:hypothetical protein
VLEDSSLCGHPMRHGDLVVVCPWVTHRSPRWWTNSDAFDPDRFIAADPAGGVPRAYFPFGLGPRQCIGERFANALIELLLAMILQRWQFRAEGLPIVPQPLVSLRPKGGFPGRARGVVKRPLLAFLRYSLSLPCQLIAHGRHQHLVHMVALENRAFWSLVWFLRFRFDLNMVFLGRVQYGRSVCHVPERTVQDPRCAWVARNFFHNAPPLLTSRAESSACRIGI